MTFVIDKFANLNFGSVLTVVRGSRHPLDNIGCTYAKNNLENNPALSSALAVDA